MTSALNPEPSNDRDLTNSSFRDSQPLLEEELSNSQVAWSVELTQLPQDVIQELHQATSKEEILTITVEEARRLLECDRVVIYSLTEPSQGTVIAEAVIAGWTKTLGMTIDDPCFESKCMDIYHNGRVKAFNNIYGAEIGKYYVEQLEQIEVKASLVAPILQKGELFGLLVAQQCSQPRKWQPEEIECLSQLATQAGLSLHNAQLLAESARLKQQAETEAQWTQYFTDATRHIRQSLQQKDILNVTVEEVRRVLDCQRVVVYSLNEDKYGVVIAESVTPGWTRALGITIKDPCFESKYLEKYENGRVRALDNIYEAGMTSCYIEQLEKLEVKANLVTPIINEGKLFGLLVAHQCS
ncbi:MAG: GAF domain-containing protein, partial [Xenococcaceae cyanobacterium]